MPQIFHVMFQSNYFHHQPPLIRPLLVHSFHLWHHQCWTQAVLFSDLLCVGAQSSRDSNCRPCTQIVADNYTCKLELDLWFCLDPLPVNPPHLHSCDTRSLLCAWSHPSLLFWFWYFSPARINLKGKSPTHFSCPSPCPFPGSSWPVYTAHSCASQGWTKRVWSSTSIIVLSPWLMWRRRHGYPRCDTPFTKAEIPVSDNQYDNKIFCEVRDITPTARLSVESKSTLFERKERFDYDTNTGINQLMIFLDNMEQKQIKCDCRINTTDPAKLCPEAADRRVSRSSIFGRIQNCPFWQEGALCQSYQCSESISDVCSKGHWAKNQ